MMKKVTVEEHCTLAETSSTTSFSSANMTPTPQRLVCGIQPQSQCEKHNHNLQQEEERPSLHSQTQKTCRGRKTKKGMLSTERNSREGLHSLLWYCRLTMCCNQFAKQRPKFCPDTSFIQRPVLPLNQNLFILLL